MSSKVVNIARNTSYYTLALIVQKVISFSYFVIIARALGPEDLGKYYLAISFTTIFAILIDLGLSNVLTREVAKKQEELEQHFNTVLAIKTPLAFVVLGLVVLGANVFHYPELTKTLIYISSISMVLDSFTGSFWAAMRGFHNLKYESIASMVFQSIVFISGLLTLWFGWGIIWLMAALALASTFNFFYSLITVLVKRKIRINLKVNRVFAKKLIVITLPFAIFAVSQRVYMYLDSVLLANLAGDRAVGVYQVAFKIINALQFLPMAFSASLYPAFATYWQKNREQLAVTFERAVSYLVIISAPITVGVLAIADKVVGIFSGGYAEAILPLQINMLALIFIFLNFAVGALLNACDRQKINTYNMVGITILSVVLNLWLIPGLGAVGATITVAVTNLLMFIIGLAVVPTIVKYDYMKVLKTSLKVLFSALIMGGLAVWLKVYVPISLVIGLSGSAYFLLLFLFKVFGRQDILSIANSFRRKKISTNEN